MKGAITVTADALRSELHDGSALAVDVRRQSEYAQGHIPGAINLPLADLLSDDSPGRVAALAGSLGIGPQTRIVTYDDTFGALASRVAWTLEYTGHKSAALLETTYSGWTSMGLETDAGSPDLAKRDYPASVQSGMVATTDYLEKARTEGSAILVDNRERLNYLEQHIPGATSLPYRALGSGDLVLRPASEIRRLLDNRGITGDKEVITYCGSAGTLSGLAYYGLKSAGIDAARLYVRSFKEWKSRSMSVEGQQDANYWDLSAE